VIRSFGVRGENALVGRFLTGSAGVAVVAAFGVAGLTPPA
jgi:hypothetical protein